MVRWGAKRVQIMRSRFKNVGCSRLLLVNLVESRLPIGQVVSKNATQKMRMKSHLGAKRVQIMRSRFKNVGCSRLLLVNLVESRLPIGQALAGNLV